MSVDSVYYIKSKGKKKQKNSKENKAAKKKKSKKFEFKQEGLLKIDTKENLSSDAAR